MNHAGRDQFPNKSMICSPGLMIGADDAGNPVRLVQLEAGEAMELGQRFAELEPWRSYNSAATSLSEFLAAQEDGAPRYGIHCNEKLAGAMCCRTNWLRGPHLQFIGILPETQKQGIGACILDWLESTAAASGGRHVWIMVAERNHDARRFYERHGYQVTAAIPDVVQDGMTELMLRKRL